MFSRSSHDKGYTGLSVLDDGSFLTCGIEGEVRKWKDIRDNDADCFHVAETCYSISAVINKFFIGDSTHSLNVFILPDGNSDAFLTRFEAPVFTQCTSHDGQLVAAGSGDFSVRTIDINFRHEKNFLGHKAPILSLAFAHHCHLLASSSSDGSIKIWNFETADCVHTITNVQQKSNDFANAKSLCNLAFNSTDDTLYYPKANAVEAFNINNKVVYKSFETPNTGDILSTISISPDDKYLCSSNESGHIFLWSIETGQMITSDVTPKAAKVTALSFNFFKYSRDATEGDKSSIEIIFCDSLGFVGSYEPDIVKEKNFENNAEDMVTEEDAQALLDDVDLMEDDDEFNDIDTFGEAVDKEVAKEKETIKKSPGAHLGDSIEDVDSDDEDVISKAKAMYSRLAGLDDDEDSNLSNEPIASKDTLADKPSDDKNEPSSKFPDFDFASLEDIPKFAIPQAAFQPGSTPEMFSSRFMVYNTIGIVTQYFKRPTNGSDESSLPSIDTATGSIDVEFHDASSHHSLTFANTVGYTMASLSNQLLVLASPGKSRDGEISTLECVQLNSWDDTREWIVTFPKGENVQCLTASDTWCAIVTSRRQVRIFSATGLQGDIISIAGSPVCLTSHFNKLLIIFHYGIGLEEEQNLFYELYEVNLLEGSRISFGPLPLSVKSTLSWAGFTLEGSPIIYDSRGIVKILKSHSIEDSQKPCNWIQFSDIRFHHSYQSSDAYWIVGASEKMQQIRCIRTKIGTVPSPLPRPILTVIPTCLPYLDVSHEKGKLEEGLWHNRLLAKNFLSTCLSLNKQIANGSINDETSELMKAFGSEERREESEREYHTREQEHLIKLFALACKSGREMRAFEVCTLMKSLHTLQLAIQYASRMRHLQLAQRISALAEEKAALEERKRATEQQSISFSRLPPSTQTQSATSPPIIIREVDDNDQIATNNTRRQLSRDSPTDFTNIRDGLGAKQNTVETEWSHNRGKSPAKIPTKMSEIPSPEPRILTPSGTPTARNPFKKATTPCNNSDTTPGRGNELIFDKMEKPSPMGFQPLSKDLTKQGFLSRSVGKKSSSRRGRNNKENSVAEGNLKRKQKHQGTLASFKKPKIADCTSVVEIDDVDEDDDDDNDHVADKEQMDESLSYHSQDIMIPPADVEGSEIEEKENERPELLSFPEWQAKNEMRISRENPDLSGDDLTMLIAKTYRSLKKQHTEANLKSDRTSEKNNCEEPALGVSKKTVSKLSAFARD